MNIINYSRRLAQGVLVMSLALVAFTGINAQCTLDPLPPYGPVPAITLPVDATAPGVADLNGSVLSSYFQSDCPFINVRLYSAATGGTYLGADESYDCSSVGTTFSVWLAVRNFFDVPGSESPRREVSVTIVDNTFPTITVPVGPFARNANAAPAGSCRYTIVGTEFNPTAVGDNCVGFTTSYRIDGGSWVTGTTLAGVQLNGAGAHSIQWRVIDASMNTTNAASFNVNITDAANPAITCPGNQNINTTSTTCNAVATGIDPIFTDNCAVTTLTWSASAPTTLSSPVTGINYASGTTFALGTTTVTYTAKDAANNMVNCMFTVTVQDMTAPTFAGVPMNQMIGTSTASMTPAVCDGSYTWNHPTFTDNCTLTFPPASLTMALSGMTTVAAAPVTPGAAITQTFNGLGATTVTYVATDNNGRTASTSFTVTVNDDVAPVVSLPADPMINVPVSGTDCSKVITFTRPSIGAVSDCGTVTMTETVISGQDFTVLSGAPAFNTATGGGDITVQFPTGLTEIEYCWVDNLSNTVCQTYSFFVDENVAPTAICQNLTRNIESNGQVTVLAVDANNGSTDNCGDITFNLVPTGMPATGTATGDDIVYTCANIGVNTFNLEVIDAAGNLSTTSCSVTITDNTAPAVSCPNDVTVNTDPTNCTATIGTLGNLVLNGNAVLIPGEYEDNCTVNRIRWTADNGALPAASPATGVNNNLSAVVFKRGVTNVVYTLRDAGNNVEVCNFQVVVNDVTAPVATGCPTGPINLAVNTTFCSHIPTAPLWNVTWADNCTAPVTNIVTTGGTPTNTYQQGETAITITATDAAGNVGTCSFVVDVAETTAPTALCKNVTVNLGSAPVTVTAPMINNGSTDNCTLLGPTNLALMGGNVTVTSATCADIPVTLVVTDRDGNTANCTANIIINDDIAPICAVNTPVISLNASGVATLTAAAVNNGSTDNCTALHPTTPFVIATSVAGLANNATSLTYTCADLGVKTVYFKVTDKNGNTCTTSTTVTIEDNIDPVGNGPADIALTCEDVAAYLTVPVTITAVENCTYTVSAVSVSAPTPLSSPTCANHYQLVRSWTVTDVAGNTDLVQQIITVEDDSKPTITLPANVTLNLSATPGNCTPSASYSAVVTDNCAGAVTTTWEIDYPGTTPANTTGTGLTATPAGGFRIGVNKITFRATDACGNSITAAMNVTVVDNVAPAFASYNVPTTSTSYCNHAPFVYANTPGNCGYTFNWVRPWVGDLSDCSTFTFATESIVAVTPTGTDVLSANFPWDQTNSLTEFVPVSISLPVGTTTFKYTATDAAGNVQNCAFNVQVQDTEAPTLSGIQTAILASICPTQTVPDYRGQVQINDNCPANVSLTQTIVSPNAIPWVAGVTTLAQVFSPATPLDNAVFIVRISATDGVNAIATRDITVTLDDNVAPVPNVTNLPATNSNCGYIILPTPTAKTNDCGPGSGATVFGTPGGVSAVSETVNGMGNITSYRVTLPPNPGQPTCQTYFITWSYNDGNGNVATQPQTVTVCPDLIAPTAVCKTTPINVTLNPTTATLAVTDVDGGSFDTDNCGTFTLGLSKTSFTCADVSPNNTGFTTVVLTATATANATQTDTCHARIRVIDNILPVINMTTVPASFTVDTCAIGYVLPVAATVTATDNCSATVSLVQTSTQGTSGTAKYNYTVTRTWTATDVFGNTATAQQTITVKDTKKPVFATLTPASLMFNTALVTANCSANTVFKVANYISDCAPDNELSIVVNPAYYSLTDTSEVLSVGSHTISFTVTDPSGNSATSTVTIVVQDATKPIASCINGISVALNANGQAIVTPVLVNNQSYDNCSPINTSNGSLLLQELDATNGDTIGAPASQLVFDCLEADNDTEYPIILWVKDAAGNFNFCETYVVIQDNVAPTLTCPPAKTIECSNNPAAFLPAALGNATATDNCPATLTLTYTDTPVNPGYLCGNRVRTFKTTDLSGNVATCTQVITVVDNKPPVFTTLPQNDTILCNDPLVVAPTLLATDNCTPADSIKITLVQTKSDSVGVCGKYQYKVTRKWTATDKCGNVNMHTQVVTVRDTLGPVFLGMPDTLKILTGNFPPSTNCTAPVAFNAAQFFSECALLTECTINSVVFKPALNPILTPTMLNVSGNYPIGNTKVIFTVTDPCGNVGKDSIVINVKDNSAPVMVCNNTVEIALSNNGQATLTPADVDLNSNDNCGIATRTLSKTLFDCEDLGVNQVILTATDIYGNANSCTVAVEVTAGPNTGFTLTTSNVVPTYFGATNGSATAAATGGSGNFTYAWSVNNATTASVTGLAAGSYTVTVTDAFTGCKQTATVTLADGPQVLFTVGNATGAQNTIVKVPVIVTNFQQLSGFTFSLNVPNAAVGTVATPALSNVTAALGTGLQTSVSGNTVSVLYLNPQGVNINLPNGTVLFNLCVQLSGASLGSSSPVTIENSPVQFTVIRATTNGPLVIPSDAAVNGSVQITQGLNDYDLGGDIYPWQAPTTGVPNVAVKVTGPATPLTSTTTTAGTYLFSSIVANTNTTTTATKSQAGNTKIDIIDQGLMLKHIFATATNPSPLTSPYQRVAADVNFDGQINIVDFALVQRLLLGTVQHIEGPNAKDWVFIPKSYAFPTSATTAFPNPTYPALPVYPQSITHNPLIQDQLDDDLVAVRIGDLNGDAPLSIQQPATDDRSGNTLKLRLDEQNIEAGNTVSLAFKAKDFTDKKGYQFTFAFDPNAFELQAIEAGAVPGLDADGNFGTTLLSEGFLSTAWVSLDAVTIEDDATLFTLVFKALENVNELSQVLNVSNEVVTPISVDGNDEVAGVELEFTAAVTSTVDVVNEKMVVYQNQPNPFRAETTIGFRLPTSDRATVRVYTASGRLVKTIIGDFEKGYNTVQVRKGDLGSAGVFWYEVTSGAFSDRKKMIIID